MRGGSTVRRRLRLRGIVQGVGFRPFVHRLATGLGLAGLVRNDAAGVEIEVEGGGDAVAAFVARLTGEAPAGARIDAVEAEELPPGGDAAAPFTIAASGGGRPATGIAPDIAVCDHCLREMFDPDDRRYRHPFINCTDCGPRYTIAARLPYDRRNTAMADFPFCADCAREYGDPDDRRFHAQPVACPACGPRLELRTADGGGIAGDPIAVTVALLRQGAIVAVKGVGGFQLLCDGRNAGAVARLRTRKGREEKPFAVMAASTSSLGEVAEVGDDDRTLLESGARPIVLLPKRVECDRRLAGVAPGLAWLGALLPCAPLHYLLFHEAAGRPEGSAWLDEPQPLLLVCTSANPGGEPLVTGNDEAVARLATIADALLVHDRAIVVRCDDSVVRNLGSDEKLRSGSNFSSDPKFHFIRRARGYTPAAIRLPRAAPAVLALGAHLKNAICLTRGDEAFLSQHIGDLDDGATCRALEEAVAHLEAILAVVPAAVACDRHPDLFSSRLAARIAADRAIPLIVVDHHHAHIAAVAAEHGWDAPLLGLALDGFGLGTDGGAWGGELLRVDGARHERLGHLAHLPLPGGDRAAREPWRMAAAALHRLGRGGEIAGRFAAHAAAAGLAGIIARGVNSPPTSSAGRLFDAAAGLLGVREVARFEGQAPMLLEGLAAGYGPVAPLTDGYRIDGGRLDFLPLLARLSDEGDPAPGAALFHATIVAGLAAWVSAAVAQTGIRTVALGGGCLLNRLLADGLAARFAEAEIEVLTARRAPPNDGGLALGQAWVAASTLAAGAV